MALSKRWHKTFDDIRQGIAEDDGVLATEAERVMGPCGWERWTMNTGPAVVRTLKSNGFDVFGDAPSHRNAEIRIFIPNTPVGRIVNAVRAPSLQGDEVLREAGRGDSGIVDQIRALVGAGS